jgi:hypothetical protein
MLIKNGCKWNHFLYCPCWFLTHFFLGCNEAAPKTTSARPKELREPQTGQNMQRLAEVAGAGVLLSLPQIVQVDFRLAKSC